MSPPAVTIPGGYGTAVTDEYGNPAVLITYSDADRAWDRANFYPYPEGVSPYWETGRTPSRQYQGPPSSGRGPQATPWRYDYTVWGHSESHDSRRSYLRRRNRWKKWSRRRSKRSSRGASTGRMSSWSSKRLTKAPRRRQRRMRWYHQ